MEGLIWIQIYITNNDQFISSVHLYILATVVMMAKIFEVEGVIWIQPYLFYRFQPILVLNISFVDLTPAGLDKIFTGGEGLDKPA